MTFTPNPYPSLDDAQYDAVVNSRYVKSTFSNGNAGCLSFTVAGGLIGVQDDKLPPAERKALETSQFPEKLSDAHGAITKPATW